MAEAAVGQLNMEAPPPGGGSRSVDCFKELNKIGEGTYGEVFAAKDIRTGETVALKRIPLNTDTRGKEGLPITAIREIKILMKLNHENVIKLKEVVTSPESKYSKRNEGNIYMVLEYMDHDLAGLADRFGYRFTVPQIKCYMKQLLTGLHYCHLNEILHRDIKASNLLIDNEGHLKLADFGLAKKFFHDRKNTLTNNVVTLWYRPPELLLGATNYGPAVDMWSVGCVFAELLNGEHILPGKTEADQLHKIFDLCGSPDETIWPGVSKLHYYNNYKPARPMKRRIKEVFKHFECHALDLLDKLLMLDPSQRISARDALHAEYFWIDPLPCDPKSLPKFETSHEYHIRKRRQEERLQRLARAAKRRKLRPAWLLPIQHNGQSPRPPAP